MLNPTMAARLLQKEDKFQINDPSVVFAELFYQEVIWRAQDRGFNPVKVKLSVMDTKTTISRVAFEWANPPQNFLFKNTNFKVAEIEGRSGRVFSPEINTSKYYSFPFGGLNWKNTLTIIGSTVLVSGNKITQNGKLGNCDLVLLPPTSTTEKSPLLRVRRAYDTVVTGEVLGVGNGVLTSFTFNIVNTPICPSSIKISFTDSGGVKTVRLRDSGKEQITTTPPEILLAVDKESTVNYDTGILVLNFATDHIPTASNITIDYEYSSTGIKDQTKYAIIWEFEEV